MNRYASVLVLAALAAVGLGLLARAPRPRHESVPAPAPAAVADSLQVVFEGGTAQPELASVAVGRRVALTLVNAGPVAIMVGLAGYEDRLPAESLEPGAARTSVVDFDRPGEAFAFLIDGEPVGRIAVTGSHLPEGHR